ncbi:MAG: uridine kinase [Actinomycetia bacterium]|nr:uridine kinase [Actinomycetes bacterium]MCP4961189.1 uridine kinase [Actinomycetes bacterium]
MDVVVVGVCGGSGSGKSSLAAALAENLGDDVVAVLPFDAYYHDLQHLELAERVGVNFDHPDSVDAELFASHLDALRMGTAVGVPEYDFTRHTRTGDHTLVEARPVVIAEGILLLCDEVVSSRLDMTVFLDVPEPVRYRRRLARDTVERGRDEVDVLRQFTESVAPMHDRFVQPFAHGADVVWQHPWDLRAAAERLTSLVDAIVPA